MPRNVYFSQTVKSEQNLYEDLIIESLKIYGQECYYLPRHMVSRDMVLNEAIESKFDDAYSIEMYLENVDGFEGGEEPRGFANGFGERRVVDPLQEVEEDFDHGLDFPIWFR